MSDPSSVMFADELNGLNDARLAPDGGRSGDDASDATFDDAEHGAADSGVRAKGTEMDTDGEDERDAFAPLRAQGAGDTAMPRKRKWEDAADPYGDEEMLQFDRNRAIIAPLARPQSQQEMDDTSDETLLEMLKAFEQIWTLAEVEDIFDVQRLIRLTRRNLEFPRDKTELMQPKDLEECVDKIAIYRLQNLHMRFSRNNLIMNGSHSTALERRFSRLFEVIFHCGETLYNANRALFMIAGRPQPASSDNMFRFRPMLDFDQCSPGLRFAIHVLTVLHRRQLRKKGDLVYEPVFNKKGQYTNAWQKCGTIREFVFGCVNANYHFSQLINMGSNLSIANATVAWITEYKTPMFPELIVNRYLLSWVNGIYHVQKDLFVKYEQLVPNSEGAYSVEGVCFDEREVSVNYFDQEFVDWKEKGLLEAHYEANLPWEEKKSAHDIDFDTYRATGMGIPTPVLDSIFDEQGYDDASMQFVYGILGRCLYWCGERDRWQCCPYLLGYGGTGKSSVLKLLRHIYPMEYIGFLANNVETQWAVSGLYQSLLIIGYEIKENFKLDQAEFQSMVSGEEVSVPIKFKQKITVDFKIPIAVAGNEFVTRWRDSSASLARRILMWRFRKHISKDKLRPRMFEELMEEFPFFVQKINLAYQYISATYGDRDIHDVLPPMMKRMNEEAMESMNPLENFLSTATVFYKGADRYCRMSDFTKLFNKFCETNNIKKPAFNREFYGSIFSRHQLTTEQKVLEYHGAPPKEDRWIFGIDIIEDDLVSAHPHPHHPPSSHTH